MYGIPEFRLPKAIVEREVDYLETLGVEIETNHVIGRTFTVDELLESTASTRSSSAPARACPTFLEHPGREPDRRLLGQRVPHPLNLMKAYRSPNYDTPIIRGRRRSR